MTNKERWKKTSADSPKCLCVNFKREFKFGLEDALWQVRNAEDAFLCGGTNTEKFINSMCVSF